MTSYLETTRRSYDTVAADYHKLLRDVLASHSYERSVLGLFAELVTAGGGGLVGDLGCGTGRVTTYLAGLGLDVFGVDLSPEMVAVARAEYPELRFEVGSLLGLDVPDGQLASALAWYSLVHTPADELPVAFAEIYRVLAPGGLLVHAFKTGEGSTHLDEAYGHELSLDVYRYAPELVGELLAGAGFVEVATLTRAAIGDEKTPQAYVLVRKPQ
jgi:SAM-dependent methyltransferase